MRKNLLKILTLVLVLAALVTTLALSVFAATDETTGVGEKKNSSFVSKTGNLQRATGVQSQDGTGSYDLWYTKDLATALDGPYYSNSLGSTKVADVKYYMLETNIMLRDNGFNIGIWPYGYTKSNAAASTDGRGALSELHIREVNGKYGIYTSETNNNTLISDEFELFEWTQLTMLYTFNHNTTDGKIYVDYDKTNKVYKTETTGVVTDSKDTVQIFVNGKQVYSGSITAGKGFINEARLSCRSSTVIPTTSVNVAFSGGLKTQTFSNDYTGDILTHIGNVNPKPTYVEKQFGIANGEGGYDYYSTYAEAEAACEEGDTVVLFGGIPTSNPITVTKPIKLDGVSGKQVDAQQHFTVAYKTAGPLKCTLTDGVYSFEDATDELCYTLKLNDGDLQYFYEPTLNNDVIKSQKYEIKLYKDLELYNESTSNDKTLFKDGSVIDLNGHTLTYNGTAGMHMALDSVTANSKLKIISTAEDKGTLTRAFDMCYFYPNSANQVGTTYYFENIVFSDGGLSTTPSNTRVGVNFVFKRCEINFTSVGDLALGHRGLTDNKSTLWLEDTVINSTHSSGSLITLSSSNANTQNWAADIFIKNCEINVAGNFFKSQSNAAKTEQVNVYIDGNTTFNFGTNGKLLASAGVTTAEGSEHNLYIGEGVKFNKNVFENKEDLVKYTVNAYDAITIENGTATLGNKIEHIVNAEDGIYTVLDASKYALYTLTFMKGDTVLSSVEIVVGTGLADYLYTPAAEDYIVDGTQVLYYSKYAWSKTEGGAAEELPETITENLTYYMVDIEYEQAKYAWYDADGAVAGASNSAQLDKKHMAAVPDGGKMVFFADIEYVDAGGFYFTAANVTLDLNNHSFTNNGTTDGSNAPRLSMPSGQNLSVINGTLILAAKNFVYNQEVVTLSLTNVHVISTAIKKADNTYTSAAPFDFRAGTLNLTDCVLDLQGAYGNCAYRTYFSGASVEQNFTRVTFNLDLSQGNTVDALFTVSPTNSSKDTDPTKQTYTVNSHHKFVDCTVNAPDANCFFATSNYIGADSTIKLTVINSDISCKRMLSTGIRSDLKEYGFTGVYHFENSKLTAAPAATIGTVTYGAGQILVATDDATYKYRVTAAPALSVNLTLYTDINFNLYIPTVTNITKVTIGGTEYVISEALPIYTDENGNKFYKLSCTAAAKAAAEDVAVEVTYTVEDMNCVATTNFSTVDYAEQILASTDTEVAKAKDLTNAIVNYIDAAYKYFGTTNANGKLAALIETSGLYTKPTLTTPEYTGNTEELAQVIESAYFSLHTDIRLVLKVKDTALDETFTVRVGDEVFYNGKAVDGKVTVSIRANYLVETITISTATVTGTYSFANYATAVGDGAEENLANMLNAIYAYAYEANAYKNPEQAQ